MDFVNNRIPAFGTLYKDFEGPHRTTDSGFIFHMLKIRRKRDLLKIYVDLNSGGTPHKPKEIARVKELIEATPEDAVL